MCEGIVCFAFVERRHVHDKQGDFREKRFGREIQKQALFLLWRVFFLSCLFVCFFLYALCEGNCDDTAVLCTHVFQIFSLKRAAFFFVRTTYSSRSHCAKVSEGFRE